MRTRSTLNSIVSVMTLLLVPLSASASVCTAGAFSCPGSGTCTITGTWDVGDGCLIDFGSRDVELRGTLRSELVGGSFAVSAASLNLFGGKLRALGNTYVPGGELTVDVVGSFSMTGTGPRIDVTGNGGGGGITVGAASLNISQGVVAADGGIGSSCGDAGLIDLEAFSGAISIGSTVSIHATTSGGDCLGGAVVVAGPSITVSGDIDTRGGGSAAEDAILLDATTGDLNVMSTATLRADGIGQPGGSGASGGGIALVAEQGNLTLAAASVSATGKSPEGAGGEVDLTSAGAMQVSSPINVSSGGTGEGGDISFNTDGALTVSGNLTAQGGSSFPDGFGGSVGISADGGMSLSSNVDVSAATGGNVDIDSAGLATISGSLSARGSYGPGGEIDVRSCSLSVPGSIDTGSSFGTPAGLLSLTGGAITIGSTAHLSALPCATSDCIALSAPSGGISTSAGAAVTPAATLVAYDPLPGC